MEVFPLLARRGSEVHPVNAFAYEALLSLPVPQCVSLYTCVWFLYPIFVFVDIYTR